MQPLETQKIKTDVAMYNKIKSDFPSPTDIYLESSIVSYEVVLFLPLQAKMCAL